MMIGFFSELSALLFRHLHFLSSNFFTSFEWVLFDYSYFVLLFFDTRFYLGFLFLKVYYYPPLV